MDNQKASPHGRRYPWDEWFGQGVVELRSGTDFPKDVQLHGMAQCIRNAASRMGLRVSVRTTHPAPKKVGRIRIEVLGKKGR